MSDEVCEYDTLVLSGGSSKGILILGALLYAQDNFLLGKVYNYIGTSAGAIICFLLIIGYTPIEIIVYLCTNQLLEKLKHFNIVAMMNGNGATSFSNIYEQLEKMTIDKLGYLPTFRNIKTRFGKNLVCVTYNLTDSVTEYISTETHPNLPCIIALKMSSNLPLVFAPFKYSDKFYIDGGISNNFAIDYGDKIGKKTLGLLLKSEEENFNAVYPSESNILEYIYKLIFIPISNGIDHRVAGVSSRCEIVKLSYQKLKFFSFNLNAKEKLQIFSSGYEQMKKHFETSAEVSTSEISNTVVNDSTTSPLQPQLPCIITPNSEEEDEEEDEKEDEKEAVNEDDNEDDVVG